MGESELPVRLAGRVIAIDPAKRVLLFFYDDPPPKGKHWTTPGGGVEPGEDFHTAARRELLEETGWDDVPVSPEEVFAESNVQWSNIDGRPTLCVQYDHYFVGPVPGEERPLGAVAAMHASDGIVNHRWWTLAELDETAEDIYPPRLADLVRRSRELLTISLTVQWMGVARVRARGQGTRCGVRARGAGPGFSSWSVGGPASSSTKALARSPPSWPAPTSPHRAA